jgi:hypothetical protein
LSLKRILLRTTQRRRLSVKFNKHATHLTSGTRLQLPHHLLLAGALLAALFEFSHVFPVALALLLLGVDATGIEGGCGGEGRSSDGGDDECLGRGREGGDE